MSNELSYRPSGYYFRRALRRTNDADELRALALAIVTEHERLKAWVRDELGYIPPKWTVHPDEAADKGWELTG
jgi:hypothetical protein